MEQVPLRNWWEYATCRDMGIALFFPVRANRGRGLDPEYEQRVQAAKDVCARCVVKCQCLEEALAEFGTGGIRGGLTEQERDGLARRRRPLVAVCGTTGGYYRHLAHRNEPCEPCRDAHRTAERRRNAARAGRMASVPPHPRHGATT